MEDLDTLAAAARQLSVELADLAVATADRSHRRQVILQRMISEHDLTQREVAALLGVSQARVAQILGVTRPYTVP